MKFGWPTRIGPQTPAIPAASFLVVEIFWLIPAGIFRFFTLIFFILFSTNIFANPAGKPDETKEFDVNEMIMHHIKDAHEFHIMDFNDSDVTKHSVSFPLPIILWTENGLITFLSSA